MAGGTSKPLSTEELVSTIREILQAVGDGAIGLTLREIYLHLRTKGLAVRWEQVPTTIRQMVEDKELEARPNPKRKGTFCFHLPDQGISQLSLFDLQVSRDEIDREERSGLDLWQEDEAERERLTASVMEEIARGHALEESFAQQVRTVAPFLADENPISLLIEMVEWVVEDLNNLASKVRSARDFDQGEVQRLTRELGFRRSKAESFFQRLWRLDRSIENVPGVLDIPTVSQMLQGRQVKVDIVQAAERYPLNKSGRVPLTGLHGELKLA